jgi:Non-ribosomal peptide synthetase modules and related proteins
VIGYFVNTLPIKADFSTDPTFIELLGQVRDTVWEAQEHQDLPFERLVKELRAVRDASRNPLFQVLVAFEMPSGTATLARINSYRRGGATNGTHV